MEYPRNDELISAYLDRELSPDERAALDRVLEKSPEARERLRELEATSRFLRRLPQRAPEPDFADSVIDRLRSESLLRPLVIEPPRPKHRMIWRIAGPLAAAAALLLGVWIIRYEPPRTVASRVPGRSSETDGSLAGVPLDERNHLGVGDAFEVRGPNGESRFQLIVFTEPSEGDAVRCILLDKTERAESRHDGLGASYTDARSTPAQFTHVLEADQEQIDALAGAYDEAISISGDRIAVVDIYASADRKVGGVTPHSPPGVAAAAAGAIGESPLLADNAASKDDNAASRSLGPFETPDEAMSRLDRSRNIASNRLRTIDGDAREAEGAAASRTQDRASTEEVDQGRMTDEAAGLANRSESVAAQSSLERVQATFRIARVRVQTEESKKPSVEKLANSSVPRIGDPAVREGQSLGRLKVLLYFEPDKSQR